jgi:rod shape-determining protein MreC
VALNRRAPRQRTLVLGLTLVSIVIVTVDLRAEDGAVSALRRTTRDVFAPIDGVVDAVVSPVADVFDGIFHAGELKDENAALREQVAQLRSDLAQIQSVIIENQELQELLDLQVAGSTERVVAQVTSGAADNFESTLRIDKGSADGLAEGMAVVIGGDDAEPVLVGRIAEVDTHAATVRLLQDPESQVSVWIPVYGETAILQGEGSADRLVIEDIPIGPNEVPAVGQVVETSGREGSEFPPGLIIGSISAVAAPRPGALFTSVDVRPIADLERITRVRVITDYTSGDVADSATTATSAPPPTTTTTTAVEGTATTAPEASG